MPLRWQEYSVYWLAIVIRLTMKTILRGAIALIFIPAIFCNLSDMLRVRAIGASVQFSILSANSGNCIFFNNNCAYNYIIFVFSFIRFEFDKNSGNNATGDNKFLQYALIYCIYTCKLKLICHTNNIVKYSFLVDSLCVSRVLEQLNRQTFRVVC